MSFEMSKPVRNFTAGTAALFAAACSHVNEFRIDANSTPQEQACHRMAKDENFLKNAGMDALIGAGAGAAGGAVVPGVSALEGALFGAAATAAYKTLENERRYSQLFNQCMQNTDQWQQKYEQYQGLGKGYEGRTVVPAPNGAAVDTAPRGQHRTAPVVVPAPGR